MNIVKNYAYFSLVNSRLTKGGAFEKWHEIFHSFCVFEKLIFS